jgi:hypothetical protein
MLLLMKQGHKTWLILPGAMSGDMWHIAASLILEPNAQLLMEVDPLFFDLYERMHHYRSGPFKATAYIKEPLVTDYNIFLEKEGLINPDQKTGKGTSQSLFDVTKRLRQHIKMSKKHYQDTHPESTPEMKATTHLFDTLLKYMASENSTMRLLETSDVPVDRYHLVENRGNLTSTEGSFHSRAIDAVIAHPQWRNISGYIGTHNAASAIVGKYLQKDMPGTCKKISSTMGKITRPEVINRVHAMIEETIKTPTPNSRVLLLNMRCAPYNRHQNVTISMLHQLLERMTAYNKTHDDKLYIRPLGAFTTQNIGAQEDIDKIRLADFVAGYTRDHPDAPILPPIDFYGRLASLEPTVDTRMTDPASIMEFWRQAAKEPSIAGVIGGRSGGLHIASYAFADPKRILAWDIPYSLNDPKLKEMQGERAQRTFRHQDFVRFAMEYPVLSIIPLSNDGHLRFQDKALGLIDNFLSGAMPQGLSKDELRSYMGSSKDYMPYLRMSPTLQPPEEMKKAIPCVSAIGEDITAWFAPTISKDKPRGSL